MKYQSSSWLMVLIETDSAAQWQTSLPIMKLKERKGMNGKSIVIFKIFYFNFISPKCNVFYRYPEFERLD